MITPGTDLLFKICSKLSLGSINILIYSMKEIIIIMSFLKFYSNTLFNVIGLKDAQETH